MKRQRTLPEHPRAWRDPGVLEELFVERGWSVADIVDHFADLGSEEVTRGRVRTVLDDNDIRCGRNNRPPQTGLQARLWAIDPDSVGGDA